MFLDRTKELKLLEQLYAEKKPKLIILYGKRRVGKTELLNEFAERHKALYLSARQESEKDQLKKISEETAEFFKDEVLKLSPFQNYDALFTYLEQKETPILFDEFPFLAESNKALPSILQEHWDKKFSKKNTFLLLCGSSIRMMESLLGYQSPLYGRRTEQILLEPMKFKDAINFFPELTQEQKIINYAILGGTPAYLKEFNYKKTALTNIKEKILQKNTFLSQDTLFVIRQELNEPSTYYSIIKSIAKGNTQISEIMNDTGLDKGTITKYLQVLQSLQLIERKVPITEKNPEKSRKGIYLLKDNYFKFWFKFVFENTEYIEQNRQEKLIEEKIKPELPAFIGKAYEEIALDWLKEQKQFNNYLIGQWWDKNNEIDITGIDKEKNQILFGEVKWKTLSKEQAMQIINKLKEKARSVTWGENPARKYMLIAKKIEAKETLAKQDYIFDVNDLAEKG